MSAQVETKDYIPCRLIARPNQLLTSRVSKNDLAGVREAQ